MSYQAKKWTEEELSTLLDYIKKGKDYKYISTKITRTEFAVKCKFESYIFEKISNKKSTQKELAKELKLAEEEINEAYQSQFKRNMSKNSQSNQSNQSNQVNGGTNHNIFQLGSVNSYSIINRIISPYIEYHQNLKQLEELKDIIDKKTYKKIKEILNAIEFDSDKFLSQLEKTSKTLQIQPEPIKSNSKTDESDVESDDDSSEEIVVQTKMPLKRLI